MDTSARGPLRNELLFFVLVAVAINALIIAIAGYYAAICMRMHGHGSAHCSLVVDDGDLQEAGRRPLWHLWLLRQNVTPDPSTTFEVVHTYI